MPQRREDVGLQVSPQRHLNGTHALVEKFPAARIGAGGDVTGFGEQLARIEGAVKNVRRFLRNARQQRIVDLFVRAYRKQALWLAGELNKALPRPGSSEERRVGHEWRS